MIIRNSYKTFQNTSICLTGKRLDEHKTGPMHTHQHLHCTYTILFLDHALDLDAICPRFCETENNVTCESDVKS